MELNAQKKFAAGLSITSNAVIILLKIIAGILSGSISIISEAIHSFSDFLASVLTFFAVTRSSEPADKEHQFGHGKYEDMSGFIEGGLIILAGLYIIYESFKKLIWGYNLEFNSMLGIYVMAFAVVANFMVSSYLFYVAKKADSVSLYADAEHLRTDIFSSLGVLIGLILIKITGIVILDPIIAIIVAIIIIKAGYSISKETLNNLLDGSLPKEDMKKIESILDNNISIKGYKDLRTRKVGQCKDIEVTIFFEPNLTIAQCHKICDEIEAEFAKSFSNMTIIIHPEPENIEKR
ncbi:TPA: cation transporter [Candidatus Avigastranaerophilus faecigallinarum]|nr:cation transporter [Candidatus Avigastranaerophilus faecigallinarum]